jgi:peptide deformylase
MINPQIIATEGEQTGEEGCLSFPGIYLPVTRAMRAVIRAQDLEGREFELDTQELAARCVLHETDHCDGILFIERVSPLKREMVKRRIKKLIKAGEW